MNERERAPVRGPGCARVRARIPVLADAGLSPLEAARDRGHLETCRACRFELARHWRFLRGIHASSRPSAAELQRLERAVLAALPSRVRSRSRWRWAAAAVLVCAWAAMRVADVQPIPVQLAGLDPVLQRLPGWSTMKGGLGALSHWFSEAVR